MIHFCISFGSMSVMSSIQCKIIFECILTTGHGHQHNWDRLWYSHALSITCTILQYCTLVQYAQHVYYVHLIQIIWYGAKLRLLVVTRRGNPKVLVATMKRRVFAWAIVITLTWKNQDVCRFYHRYRCSFNKILKHLSKSRSSRYIFYCMGMYRIYL